LVTQNGVAYMQLDEVTTTAKRLAPIFTDWHFYGAAVPTYIGGIMTFAWGCDNAALRQQQVEILKDRFIASGITTRYYNPAIHHAAFALPQYIAEAIGKN
jgi:spermidine synthase